MDPSCPAVTAWGDRGISGLIYALRIIAFRRQAWHSPIDREHPSVLGCRWGWEKRLIVGNE